MSRNSKTIAILFTLVAGLATGPSQAQQGDWNYTAAVYLFASSLNGTSTVGDLTIDMELPFSDAVQELDSAFTFHFEMQNDRWGWFADYQHLGLAPEATLSFPNNPTLRLDLTNNLAELGGTYRFANAESLELLGGVRYAKLKIDLTVNRPNGTRSATAVDESWWDGFLGLRYTGQISDKFSVVLRGDVGTGDSDLVWNAIASARYSFNDLFSVLLGYRWLDYDYETGEGADYFAYDMRYDGPVIAAGFSW